MVDKDEDQGEEKHDNLASKPTEALDAKNSGLVELLNPIQEIPEKNDEHREQKMEFDSKFVIYGPAIYSFFKVQKRMISIFFWSSLLAAIQIIIFATFGGLDSIKGSVFFTANWSFGNMGASSI